MSLDSGGVAAWEMCQDDRIRRTASGAAGVGLEAAGWTAMARFWFAVVLVAAGAARSTCNKVLVSAPVRFCLHGDVCTQKHKADTIRNTLTDRPLSGSCGVY